MNYLRYPLWQVVRTDENRVITEVSNETVANNLAKEYTRLFNRTYHVNKVEKESTHEDISAERPIC